MNEVDPIMRFPDVQKATGKPRPSIYADIKRGTFPQPQKIGARAVGWRRSIIESWLSGMAGAGLRTSEEVRDHVENWRVAKKRSGAAA